MKASRLETLLAISLSLLLAACGGTPPAENGNGEEPCELDDTCEEEVVEEEATPPTLVSISPENLATGLRADTSVVFVFSKPMDQASVEGTLATSDLGDVTFSWNTAGDTLTITPDEPLAYAQGIGTNPGEVDAITYSVILGSAAKDVDGNELGTGTHLTFSTLKEMQHVFDVMPDLTESLSPSFPLYQADLAVGDLYNDVGVRTLLTFDLALLPFSTVEIASAVIATEQFVDYQLGLPYGDGDENEGLGQAVLIDHISFFALDASGYDASESAHANLGEFCVAGQVIIEKDVTAAVEDDRVNRDARGARSQFLLRFESETDGNGDDDLAVISRVLTELQVVYLAE